MERPPNLTIEFLEDAADGLRLITASNWSVECLLASRSRLASGLREELDAPGVYMLIGPSEPESDGNILKDVTLYVGQGDSVAERLNNHLRSESKSWWRTAVALKRPDKNPLNLSHCKFLESKFYALAVKSDRCILANKVAPQPPSLSRAEQSNAEDFIQKSLVILNAVGWNFFESSQEPKPEEPPPSEGPPALPSNLQPLLEDIQLTMTGPSFPHTHWYWTQTPDYRAKFASGDDFRVFARISWAKRWLWLRLKDVGNYKIGTPADINDQVRNAIVKAHQKAEQYLRRGK